MPNIPPISGPSTESAIPQAGQAMVVPAENELPNESMENAKQGGRIYTAGFDGSSETRPQELHSSVKYQEQTADPGKAPGFVAYTDLTKPRGKVIG